MELTTILLIVGAVVAVYAIWAYNHFVSLTQRAIEAWADIDVQLKRRYDLIPNLVESVKGYAAHESGTLSAVTDARAKATQVHVDPSNITPAQMEAMAAAEGALSASLGKLLAIAESYPDLKASANFVELQRELTDTENKIQAARRFYNGNVRDLTTSLQSFPGNVIGSTFGFKEREYFELGANEQAAKDPVKVSF
jgi:LemA protein